MPSKTLDAEASSNIPVDCNGANSNNQLGNLAMECNGKTSCSYYVNHNTIGDPASGCAKTYEYKWNCGATSFSETASAEASGKTITLDCPADPCANSAKEYEYMFKCSAGDTALWSSGARPSCQEYGGTVWAMCNGKPYERHGYGSEGITQAIGNCNYAYTNPAGSHYGTLCPKLYTVAAEAQRQNVVLSCSEEVGGQPEINILTYPDVVCPSGYRDVLDAGECEQLANSNGMRETGARSPPFRLLLLRFLCRLDLGRQAAERRQLD